MYAAGEAMQQASAANAARDTVEALQGEYARLSDRLRSDEIIEEAADRLIAREME